MNYTFTNSKYKHKMIINDEGVTITHIGGPNEEYTWFFPYGSIDSISVKMVSVTFNANGGEVSSYYYFSGDKGQYKSAHDEILKLNRLAEKAEAKFTSTAEPLVLEKTFDSFKKYFAALMKKHTDEWDAAITGILHSMDDDEEILMGFQTWIMEMNRGRESVTGALSVITNKKFYYAGADGKKTMFWMKSGVIQLKDVHAITVGAGTFTAPPYIQFEVKNDDYKVSTYADTTLIKKKLEEGISACDANAGGTVIQAALSPADEIKKYKELLDMGIITQEEFDGKKKQLLGL